MDELAIKEQPPTEINVKHTYDNKHYWCNKCGADLYYKYQPICEKCGDKVTW